MNSKTVNDTIAVNKIMDKKIFDMVKKYCTRTSQRRFDICSIATGNTEPCRFEP